MSAAGYGSTRPLVPDSDPSYVTVNRRVDIIVASTASAEANALLPGLEAAAQNGTPAPAPAAAAPGTAPVSTTEDAGHGTTADAGHGTTDSEGGHG
jgi:chemotaxis protein MotB